MTAGIAWYGCRIEGLDSGVIGLRGSQGPLRTSRLFSAEGANDQLELPIFLLTHVKFAPAEDAKPLEGLPI